MTSSPSTNFLASKDFEYDHKDQVIMSTAFKELKEADTIGFRYGLASSFGSYLLFERAFRWSFGTKLFGSVIAGVSIYNIYTHKSRSYYDHLASSFNRRVSLELNSMMH